MSNWNQNGNSFNWQPQAPPFYPSNNPQQQYVGFNDFLNHYQMYNRGPYQGYQYSQMEQPHAPGSGYSSSYNVNGTTSYPRNYHHSEPYTSTQVPSFQDNNTNNTYASAPSGGAGGSCDAGKPMSGPSVASTSKLTPTAEEFIPQGLMTLTINQDSSNSVINESPAPINKTSHPRGQHSDDVSRNKSVDSRRAQNNKTKYQGQTNKSRAVDHSNWRERQGPEPRDAEAGSSAEQSITIYNSNRPYGEADGNYSNRAANTSRDTTYYGHDKPSRREHTANGSNHKYRGHHRERRGEETSDTRDWHTTNRNQRNYEEHCGEGTRPRESYSVNESFKQRKPTARNPRKGHLGEDGEKQYSPTRLLNESSPTKENANIGQRERLTEQLNRGNLECLVCCDRVKQQEGVWSCGSCFHVLHLKCVNKWANSSLQDGAWRCPACQNQLNEIPSTYYCFCGGQRNPEWHRGGADIAHSCGEVCTKTRSCALHPCTLLCHPGPCPTCENMVVKKCECGATQQQLKCSQKTPLLCGGVCGKFLECRVHTCSEKCHEGACQPCKEVVTQKCYCLEQTERTVNCESATVGVDGYSCGKVCGRTRTCGHHKCPEVCHPGACPKCPSSPELVTHCPCGQTRLEKVRKSCLDPIPTCDKVCSLPLGCGPSDALHMCPAPCHQAPCPVCESKTPLSCRCGHISKEVPCKQLEEVKDTIRCGRKCTKKQSCGRHKCKESCCVDSEHRCPLPCTRTLSCGLHRCEDTCHRGHCQPCWRVSFEELRCRCGASVRYPPVECGARPPACSQPCTVTRACGHPPNHTCHPAHTLCPPCTVLTQRYCHGKHKLRKTIPCHQEDYSCGLPCGKDMPCGKHKCVTACHKGDCPGVCTQLCNTQRHGCEHPCNAKCGHPSPCPSNSPCKAPVTAKCPCGRRSEVRPCHEQVAAQRKLQMIPGPLGEPVDISELIKKGNNQVTLECDLDCQTEDRNRRLAIGLQIRNPDLSSKLAPKYSDFLKQFCTKDENFACRIFDQLRQLVTLSKESKQRTRSHSFQPMSRSKREFVHELCQHFGCESASYDSEPYRNIVATAYKEKSWLPAMSLMEVVRREKGQRKVPPPILNKSSASGSSAWATLSSSNGSSLAVTTAADATDPTPEPPRKPRIDYFDMVSED